MDTEVPAESTGISTTWMLVYTALALLAVHQLYKLYKLTYFWRRGIKGPMPLPLLGNFPSIILNGFALSYVKWSEKYGKTFGIYFGGAKVMVLGDADVARQITTKDFNAFQARNGNEITFPGLEEGILTAHGEPWKRGRSYMSPTFSGSKMKQLVPIINNKCNIMMEILDKKAEAGESFHTKAVYGAYVLDNVASCAFGIEANCQIDPDDPFTKHAKLMSSTDLATLGLVTRVFAPKFLAPIIDNIYLFDIFPKASIGFFSDIIKKALELRKETGGTKTKDFLQLMIESSEGGGDEGDADGQVANSATKKKIPATAGELMGNSMAFFLAGYDTVSSTLALASYALATYPEVQQKVQEEIDEIVNGEGDVTYEAVNKMEYLEKVWCEAQRMWPVAFLLERKCNQEVTYNGITIPAGQQCHINVWDLHHDPKHWTEPYTFNPENFSKEAKESRHPCAWMPFGYGPRNCVGMRFAILESKIMLVQLLRKYNLEVDPQTPDLHNPKNFGNADMYPKKGIHIRLAARSTGQE